MGGINHKPTDGTKLVASSARVSRVLGRTLEAILAANTSYEEAIIAALNGSYDEALAHHDQSPDLAAPAGERLHDIDAAYAMLLEDPVTHRLQNSNLISFVKSLRGGCSSM